MRFLYCKECGNIRPRGWMFFLKRCEICRSEMVIIKVRMTKMTSFYYVSLAATFVVLALYLAKFTLPFDTYLLLAMVIVTMVLAFIDYSLSLDLTKEMVKADETARKKQQ
jgi:hypothetical protein